MSNNSNSGTSGGIGLLGATFLVFLVLKLTHSIEWSWVWVTAPLWGAVALGALIIIVALIAVAFRHFTSDYPGKKKKPTWLN